MKSQIYKICSVLIILLSALNARSEVIVGISDPFQFGDTSVTIPLSPLALIIPALMIGLFTYWRYFNSKRKEAV
jgi:hypothetical protein